MRLCSKIRVYDCQSQFVLGRHLDVIKSNENKRMVWRISLIPIWMAVVLSLSESFIIEKEFQSVTCGSWLKLAHQATSFRLHSHEVKYGSGSGQQSVTAFPQGDDPNSYFQVLGPIGTDCKRGNSFKCGDLIRLLHQNTGCSLLIKGCTCTRIQVY